MIALPLHGLLNQLEEIADQLDVALAQGDLERTGQLVAERGIALEALAARRREQPLTSEETERVERLRNHQTAMLKTLSEEQQAVLGALRSLGAKTQLPYRPRLGPSTVLNRRA